MTRVVVYALVGLVLSAAGIDLYSEWFWCLLALFICSDYLSRSQGFDLGVAAGISAYSNANEQQRADLDKIVKSNHND
jgi:hypothetical protein